MSKIKCIALVCLALIFSTQTNSPAQTKAEGGKTTKEQISPDVFRIIIQITAAENRIKENIDNSYKKLNQDIEKLKKEIITQLNEMQKRITVIEDNLRQNREKNISSVKDIKEDLKKKFNLLSFVIAVVFITFLVSLILTSKRYKRKRYF